MSDRVRVGVIGTSQFADLMHLAALKSHSGAEIAAICGRNQDRAHEVARKHGIPRVFADYREMIEKAGLDAVVVAAPDDLHYAMTMDALNAGLHVLCEKPLANTATQAKEMLDKAESAGLRHMIDFTSRWFPHYRHAKSLMDGGYVGRPLASSLRYLTGYALSPAYSWRLDRERANGVLGDLGSHMIDLARWYVGDVARASAHLAAYTRRTRLDGEPCAPANDIASLLLEFESGAQGIIEICGVAHTGKRGLEQHVLVHGDLGTLEIDFIQAQGMEMRGMREGQEDFENLPVPAALWCGAETRKPLMARLGHILATQSVADRLFIDAILEDRPITPSFHDGWKAQQVIDAALRSHQEGRWVEI